MIDMAIEIRQGQAVLPCGRSDLVHRTPPVALDSVPAVDDVLRLVIVVQAEAFDTPLDDYPEEPLPAECAVAAPETTMSQTSQTC